MNSQDMILGLMRSMGRADALDLRARAGELDGTAIIAEESKIPAWDGGRDYSQWPAGAPVTDDGQVWVLLQPHNAAHYAGRPASLRALWGLAHTKDPAMAKPFVAPLGTSGLYMAGECCTDGGAVFRCMTDNTAYSPAELPSAWVPAQSGAPQ